MPSAVTQSAATTFSVAALSAELPEVVEDILPQCLALQESVGENMPLSPEPTPRLGPSPSREDHLADRLIVWG